MCHEQSTGEGGASGKQHGRRIQGSETDRLTVRRPTDECSTRGESVAVCAITLLALRAAVCPAFWPRTVAVAAAGWPVLSWRSRPLPVGTGALGGCARHQSQLRSCQ
jgi:hypothetical protein